MENPITGIVALGLIACSAFWLFRNTKSKESEHSSLIFSSGSINNVVTDSNWFADKAITDEINRNVVACVVKPIQTTDKNKNHMPYVTRLVPGIKAIVAEVSAGQLNMISAVMQRNIEQPLKESMFRHLGRNSFDSKLIVAGAGGITGMSTIMAWKLLTKPTSIFSAVILIGETELKKEEPTLPQISTPKMNYKFTSISKRNDLTNQKSVNRKPVKDLAEEKLESLTHLGEACASNDTSIIISCNIEGQDNINKKKVMFITALATSRTSSNGSMVEVEKMQAYMAAESSHWARSPSICTHTRAYTISSLHEINQLANDLQNSEKKVEVYAPFNHSIPLFEREPIIIAGVGNAELLEQTRNAIEILQGKKPIDILKPIESAEDAEIVLFINLFKEELQGTSYERVLKGWLGVQNQKEEIISCIQ